jgi:hypothetical protein
MARWAIESTVWGTCRFFRTHSNRWEGRESACVSGIGCSMNCDCPSYRWGGTTSRRATLFAAFVPNCWRNKCRQQSVPAAVPAEVTIPWSSPAPARR